MAESNTYRYTSNEDPYSGVGEVIVGVDDDGNQKAVKLGETVELTEDEAANARKSGVRLTKLSDEQVAKLEGSAEETPAESPRATRSRRGTPEAPEAAGANPAGSTSDAPAASDGQGSEGASGQDAGTTTGGTR